MLDSRVRELGFSNPDWLVRMQLDVPYFRMNDVTITVRSVTTKGPVYNGLNCEARLFIAPSPDVKSLRGIVGVVEPFRYMLISKPNGDFDLVMY